MSIIFEFDANIDKYSKKGMNGTESQNDSSTHMESVFSKMSQVQKLLIKATRELELRKVTDET